MELTDPIVDATAESLQAAVLEILPIALITVTDTSVEEAVEEVTSIVVAAPLGTASLVATLIVVTDTSIREAVGPPYVLIHDTKAPSIVA